MSLQDFSSEFADAVEVAPETINGDTVFKDLDIWDSLSVLVVIAMVDARFGVTINGDDLNKTTTVADLFALVQDRQK